ncbi:hypothetical protein [Poriferisphaera sp. WC338]|uniref:hypothetical protein n=1 Tax=Poriferisphaera sp. WC338 TaxID=3425129 RepID=UPI003D816553
MDDKHRTEPKFRDEELQDAIDRLSIFWEKFGSIIMIALILVLGSYAGYNWFKQRAANAHEESWASLVSTNSPASLVALAKSTSNDSISTLAYLRAGDGFLAEGSIPPNAETPEDKIADNLQKAADAYSKVMQLSQEPAFTINALLGLAAVAESQNDWAAATANYDKAIQVAGNAKLDALKTQAEKRKSLLPGIQPAIEFAPEPPPVAAEPLVETKLETSATPEAAAPTTPAETIPAPTAPTESQPAQ